MKKLVVIILGLLLAVALVIGMWGVGTYNSLVGLSQGVDKQWAQVQSVYQRRADLIPNLVNTVSGAANFEKSTLTEVTQARASVGQVSSQQAQAPTDPLELEKFQQAQNQLGGALSRLLVVVERYPDLKSNTNFRDLQAQLEGTENRITVERQRFNDSVQTFNTKVKRFPGALLAGMFGFHPRPYFASQAGAENAPKVNFDFNKTPAAQ